MIYTYDQFLDFLFETQEGKSSWSYKDFLIRMYGPNYMEVMPKNMFVSPRREAYDMFEQTYDTT